MRPIRSLLLSFVLGVLPAALAPQPVSALSVPSAEPAVPLHEGLGRHHYTITAAHPLVQRYFDQGLRLIWAFNHSEAVRSFEEGERLDPTCAMCAWGVAFALGPNINSGMDRSAAAKAWAAVQRARNRAGRVTGRERALIDALVARYAEDGPGHRARLDSAWARAIGKVADRFPEDHEAQVLHADALMNLSPWNYWTADLAPRPGTARILARLTSVLRENPDHPGACHLLIHAVESARPSDAVPCAERLAVIAPGAGHLLHMAAHIFLRVGRFGEAVDASREAARADRTLLAQPGVDRGALYAGAYMPHDQHFLAFAATMAGMRALAIAAARETARTLRPEVVRSVPWVESIAPIVPLTLVTFGQWRAVLAEPAPLPATRPFEAGMTWYARGVAHAALGDREAAGEALARVEALAAAPPPGDNGTALRIAVHALRGEIAWRSGSASAAVPHFRAAAALEDALSFGEPPVWYYPVRHSLGAVLLAAGQPQEAERAYREDLARHPANGWSLHGLALSLEAQERHGEAARVRREFAAAWRSADVRLVHSRF